MNCEEYMELITSRASCRKYSDKIPEKDDIMAVLEAARLAPSACNSQPWRYIAVNDRELSPQIAECVQGLGMNRFASECPAFIVVIQEKPGLLPKIGGAANKQDFAPIDLGLSVMQLCLAAETRGLSTCIMGWLNAKKIRSLLSLKESDNVRLVIGIGYAADGWAPAPKKRKPLEDIAKYIG